MVNLGIVVSEYRYDITKIMLEKAKEHADFLGAKVKEIITVPGAFEIPFGAKRLVERKDIDAVVTLAAIIEGETDHDKTIANVVSKKIIELSLQYNKPIAYGISGPKMTRVQAIERAESYAKRAVESAVKLCRLK